MSDFFRDIHGSLRDPIGEFNSGAALPPRDVKDSLFGGLVGSFNSGDQLLGGSVAPYQYDPSFSSDLAYLNIPHSLMKVIQPIILPESGEHNGNFKLTHSVSYGGLAFSLKIPRNSVKEVIDNAHTVERAGLSPEAHVNLAIVNYLFHGLQRYCHSDDTVSTGNLGPGKDAWQFFYRSLKIPKDIFPRKGVPRTRADKLKIALWLQEHFIKCFGVVHASDKQGGQHQSNSNPIVTWPVDYVVNMVVDGKVMNMTNIWRHLNINAGDDLILRLRYVPATEYTLVAYPKNLTRKTFPPFENSSDDGVWQLVPDIFDVVYRDPLDYADGPMRAALPTEDPTVFDYREQGYWHVARSHAYWGHMPVADIWGNDELQYNGNGALLQATFAPEFMDPLRGDMDTTYSSIMGLETEEDPFTAEYVGPGGFEEHNRACRSRCTNIIVTLNAYMTSNDPNLTAHAAVEQGRLVNSMAAMTSFITSAAAGGGHFDKFEKYHKEHEARITTLIERRNTEWRNNDVDVKNMIPIRQKIIRDYDTNQKLELLLDSEYARINIGRNETMYGQLMQVFESVLSAFEVVFDTNEMAAITVDDTDATKLGAFQGAMVALADLMQEHTALFLNATGACTVQRLDSMSTELTNPKYQMDSTTHGHVHFSAPIVFAAAAAAPAPAATDEPMQVDAAAAGPPATEPAPAPTGNANATAKKKRVTGAGAAVI